MLSIHALERKWHELSTAKSVEILCGCAVGPVHALTMTLMSKGEIVVSFWVRVVKNGRDGWVCIGYL